MSATLVDMSVVRRRRAVAAEKQQLLVLAAALTELDELDAASECRFAAVVTRLAELALREMAA
jgi:hypothetical protein